ncbi:hypothetical protein [uncultured Clostridium sp.]|uniref:hypothetical protein n=1 Tax=uncultured Clostridium sp. TaxID=59620 RepID=UPI002585C1FD|nr:hypothetical protein [uncultured Clostridium sp.]
MIYRKVPVEIEAFQFYVDNIPDWFMDKVTSNEIILRNCDDKRYSIDEAYCEINTLEGVMIGNGGDYIIKGVNGEIYPCKPDIFRKTYEEVGGISPRIEASVYYQELREKMLEARKNQDVDMDKFYNARMRGFAECMESLDK